MQYGGGFTVGTCHTISMEGTQLQCGEGCTVWISSHIINLDECVQHWTSKTVHRVMVNKGALCGKVGNGGVIKEFSNNVLK